MYLVIESSNNTKTVVGEFNTYLEAENLTVELFNNNSDYYIYKLTF